MEFCTLRRASGITIPSSLLRNPSKHSTIERLSFHLHTVYLFTANDVGTFVVPNTIFGVLAALSSRLDVMPAGVDAWEWRIDVLTRIPYIVIFSWINLLIYDLANQRLPNSIEEDRINKPHRPLPQGRLSMEAAKHLLLFTIPVAWAVSWWMNVLHESAFIVATTWMYNDLGAGDLHFAVRNGILSIGFALWNLGALKIAAGVESASQLSPMAIQWVLVVSAVIFSTITIQDLKDQVGDREKDRRTAPIVMGDDFTRWMTVIPIAVWMIVCPAFWSAGALGFFLSLALGSTIIVRLLRWRDARSDDITWKLWALWQMAIYALPVLA